MARLLASSLPSCTKTLRLKISVSLLFSSFTSLFAKCSTGAVVMTAVVVFYAVHRHRPAAMPVRPSALSAVALYETALDQEGFAGL
eukprot:m.70878 g.70878  ORF g.70878 m.70878 type:complete len:86 (+) comp7611_c0_seq2:111-368(+)